MGRIRYSGVLTVPGPWEKGVLTPTYAGWNIMPAVACWRLWQWSIQMPGLSARRATSQRSPGFTSKVSSQSGLPVVARPLSAQHQDVVSVRMHRVGLEAAVHHPHPEQVAFGHKNRRDVGVDPAVDRLGQSGPAVQDAR
jgi:hypothetical protein